MVKSREESLVWYDCILHPIQQVSCYRVVHCVVHKVSVCYDVNWSQHGSNPVWWVPSKPPSSDVLPVSATESTTMSVMRKKHFHFIGRYCIGSLGNFSALCVERWIFWWKWWLLLGAEVAICQPYATVQKHSMQIPFNDAASSYLRHCKSCKLWLLKT